jgi:glutamate---cysteine ligase / carboxylate-amine ligase
VKINPNVITLGVEEELQVVDAESGDLIAHDRTEADEVPHSEGSTTHEIHRCTIELQTRICSTPDQIVRSLAALRLAAQQRTEANNAHVLAAGLHPFACWHAQPLYEDAHAHPHYAHLLTEYGDVARGAMSFGLHVHLGLPDPAARMPVMNALRSVLPVLMALSASSPFFEGRDTGLQSWRHSLLGRYPRMGIPDVWHCEKDYLEHVARLQRMGCLQLGRGLWEDVRLHLRYGTLEVRIADAVTSLDRVWLMVALLQAEAHTLLTQWQAGTLPAPWPRSLIEENKWRARRHGLNATWVDWTHDREQSTAQLFEHWAQRLRPASIALGWGHRLERALDQALQEDTSATQQRRFIATGQDLNALVAQLVSETNEQARHYASGLQ